MGRPLTPANRLLALDIDGTLLRSDKQLTPRVRQAVQAARDEGVQVVLVTGRRPPAARRIADLLGGGFPMVLHNGALIVEDGTLLRCFALPLATALRAIAAGRAAGFDPVVHVGQRAEGGLLVEGARASNTLLAYYLDKSHPDVRVVERLEQALDEDPIQVMFGDRVLSILALEASLRALLGAGASIERTVYRAQDTALLDILHPRVGKAEALAFLCARYAVRAAQVLAIGDNWNDREMLMQAGRGVVMGNADPALHRLGLEIAPTSDEDGAAWAIERYLLPGKKMRG